MKGREPKTPRLLLLSEVFVDQFFQRSAFCRFCCIGFHEMMIRSLQFFVKAQNVIRCDQINNARRSHAVNLFLQDMANTLFVIRERGFQPFTAIEPLHDLCDIQP